MNRPLTSFTVVHVSKGGRRGPVSYYLMFSNEKKPELVGREFWDSPQVCAERLIEDGKYEMHPARDGGLLFMKFNP